MSSRVLRKLQGEKELPDDTSDIETEDLNATGGARRKQFNINRYDLLNQQSHSESEVKEDDNETEAAKSCEGDVTHESVKRKRKKKKKKSGKNVNTQRSSEDNAEIDEVERSVREVNRLLGDSITTRLPTITKINPVVYLHSRKNVLNILHKNLNPNNELKRIFGSKIVVVEHKRKNRGSRGHVKSTVLVNTKDNWPQVSKSGLSMSLIETKPDGLQYFAYEHSTSYRQVQNKFLEAVESLNPDNIVAIISDHPYHVDALIQLSDLCKLSEDLAMAAELIERALYCLECAFHPLFNIAQGNCRMDYRRQENRSLFVTLFKHLLFVGGRACYRTALEFCKLLLSLDPEGDPIGVILAMDFYALRAKEYNWLLEFAAEFESTKNLSQLPNFAFSLAIAQFYVLSSTDSDTSLADNMLQEALLMFPNVLMPLLDKCSVQIDSRVAGHSFFINEKRDPPALTQLILLYINRSYYIWKENNLLAWLEKNVHKVLDTVDKGEPLIQEFQSKRIKRFQGSMPLSIARHILLSDVKGVSPVTDDYVGPVLSFDPLPPTDSINSYTRPARSRPTLSNSSTMGIFFRSLLPGFNANNIPVNFLDGDEEGARALPNLINDIPEGANVDGVDLRTSVASLVGAMRDLLNNIRARDVPNDADVDDDSEEENEHNNYLT